MADSYQRVSKCYNLLSSVYSLGAVGRCRMQVLSEISPGDRVCFLGVGMGEEALAAAQAGAMVDVVDTSESMLAGFADSLAELTDDSAEQVKIHHLDVREFCLTESSCYDVVVCHFFLNVFDPSEMPKVLEMVAGLISQEGKLVIGDFWYDNEAPMYVRWMQKAHWNTALFIFTKIVKNAKHPIYVYDKLIESLDLNIVRECEFKVLGIPMYRSVVVKN